MASKKVSEMTEEEIGRLTSPAGGGLVDEIADSIADWFGRSTIQPDRELAASIILRLTT